MRIAWVLLTLAACHAAPAAHPTPPTTTPPPPPTTGLATFLAAQGTIEDADGRFALGMPAARGCSIDLRWDAKMTDGGTLAYLTSLDLGGVRDVSTYAENDRWCIEVATGEGGAHIVMHMTSPHVKPLDRTMDDSSWGVCSDHDYIDRIADALRRAATRCGAALR